MPKVGEIPGLKKLPKPGGCFTWYWAASQITREAAGFLPRTARLWHGQGEPTAEELTKVKASVQRLSQELEDWRLRERSRFLAAKFRAEKKKIDRRSRRGTIYFVRAGERVKIGFTQNLKRRLSQLQTFFPYPLELLMSVPGSLLMEQELHRVFSELNITREWFLPGPELLAFIDKTNRAAARGNNSEPIFSESLENRS
jgi:hypothetical protein